MARYTAARTLLMLMILVVIVWFVIDYLQYQTYQIQLSSPIQGLTEDAPVEFNGVVVGSISKIAFVEHNPKRIQLILRIKDSTPITKGTVASLQMAEVVTQRATGYPYIYVKLTDDGKDLQPLKKLKGHPYHSIRYVGDGAQPTSSMMKMSESIQKLEHAIEPLLTADNIESLKELLYSLQQVSNILSSNGDKIETLLKNSAKASIYIEPLARSGNETMQILKSQTLPQMHYLIIHLEDMLKTTNNLMMKLSTNPSVIIRGEGPLPLGPGETRPALRRQ